jgi:hypothetical protein
MVQVRFAMILMGVLANGSVATKLARQSWELDSGVHPEMSAS